MENSITLSSFTAGAVAGMVIAELRGFNNYLMNNFDMRQERYKSAIKISESIISMLLQHPFENRSKEEMKFLIDVYKEARIHRDPYDKDRLENIAFLMKVTLDWMDEQKQSQERHND